MVTCYKEVVNVNDNQYEAYIGHSFH